MVMFLSILEKGFSVYISFFFSGLKPPELPKSKDPKHQFNVEIYQLNPESRLSDTLAVSDSVVCISIST